MKYRLMNSVLDTTNRNSLIERIGKLHAGSAAQWGKMNITRMIRHCSLFEDLAFGTTKYKQSLLGKIFGKTALKGMLKDEAPMKKSMPTFPRSK